MLGGAIVIEAVFSYPGIGLLDVPGDRCLRLPRAAGCVPHQQHRRRDRQPDRGPDVRLPRPTDRGGLTWPSTRRPPKRPSPDSPRRLAWNRRRRAFAGHWAVYRRNRHGMIGLSILVFFILAGACVAFPGQPRSDRRLVSRRVCPTIRPTPGYPLGTDNFGRSVLSLIIVGSRISLLVGITATVCGHGARRIDRRGLGLLRRQQN